MTRAELRTRMRAERRAIDPQRRADAQSQVCRTLRRWLASSSVSTFASYSAIRGELSLEQLHQSMEPDWVLALPRVLDATNLAFHRTNPLDQLQIGAFGILEPEPDAPQMLPGSIQMIVVPGLAFDHRGGRLGWGRGFYDRALRQWPSAVRIGVAFSTQVVECVPTSAWDVDVDYLITEKQLVRCPGAGRDRLAPTMETAP